MSDFLRYFCGWNDCTFNTTNKRSGIWHVICNHVSSECVPFYCSLCGYRSVTQNQLNKHIRTYRPHLEEKKRNPDLQDESYFRVAEVPYNVTWGQNGNFDLLVMDPMLLNAPQSTEVQVSEERVEEVVSTVDKEGDVEEEIEEVVNVDEITGKNEDLTLPVLEDSACQTEEDHQVRDLKRELNVLKGAHQAELKRFANYIERLEEKMRRKDQQIDQLRKELRDREPFQQGFQEMWEREQRQPRWEEEDDDKENSPPNKRVKSVVRKLF